VGSGCPADSRRRRPILHRRQPARADGPDERRGPRRRPRRLAV